MIKSDGTALGTRLDTPVRIGAGGYITGQTQSLDGLTRTIHTDTYGGYFKRSSDTEWKQLLDYNRIGAFTTDGSYPVDFDSAGVYAAAVAPSDGTKGYFVTHGKIFRTVDNWETFTACPLSAKHSRPNNGIARLWNDKLAVDATNPLVAVVGFQGNSGAYYTTDGFLTSPTKITTVPDAVDVHDNVTPLLIACDPTSASGGSCQTWYIASYGSGIYRSTTGPGGPYSLLNTAGMPTTCVQMVCDDWGDLFVIEDAAAPLKKYASGAWSTEGLTGRAWYSYSFNPFNRNQRILFDADGFNSQTMDVAGVWVWQELFYNGYPYDNSYTTIGNGPRWIDGSPVALYPSKVQFSRSESGLVQYAHGTGVAKAHPPTWAENWHWTDESVGIEQLVANQGVYTAGKYFLSCWDKGWFQTSDFDVYPEDHYPTDVYFTAGWSVDAAGDHVIAICSWFGNQHRISHDGGLTWETLADHPNGGTLGGCVAIGSSTDIVWVPANDGRAVTSIDGGATWQYLVLGSALPVTGSQGWSYAYYFNKRNVIASKNTPGTWWAWNYGTDLLSGSRLWKTTTGPQGTWSDIFTGAPSDNGAAESSASWAYNMRLDEVPGHPGYLIISTGADQVTPLCRSTDGGINWGPITTSVGGTSYTIMSVGQFDFGKAAHGSAYPAIRYFGTVNGVRGFYETLDNFVTSTFLTLHVDGWMDEGSLKCIVGNRDIFGEWVYGFHNSGWKGSKLRHKILLSPS